MLRHAQPLWIATLLVLLGASGVFAQGSDRVEEELRKTDEGLQRAQEIVRESGSERARTLLENAFTVQERAWGQHRNGRSGNSARLTLQAREIGARAVTFARQDQALEQRARREGERAERALMQVMELVGDRPSAQVEHLLREGRALLERGRVQMQEQHFEAALRLAVSAQRMVRQAAGLVRGGSDLSRVLRELERTDSLIERIGPIVGESGNGDAIRIMERGLSLQGDARNAYRNQQARLALARTREARGLLNRARSQVLGPVNEASVERSLAETQERLDRAAEEVGESGDERARGVLERAVGHQSRAKRLLQEDKLRQALAETRVARSLAQRALRMVQEAGGAR